MLRFARPGDAHTGALAAAPLRALAPVMTDGLGVLPVAQTDRIYGAGAPVPGPSWGRSLMLTSADDDLASAVLEHCGPDADHPFMAVELRHVSGATARDVAGGSAVSGRGAAFTFGVAGVDPATFATVLPSAATSVLDALAPWTGDELNPNFAVMGAARWSDATTDRLRDVRRRYDPSGVFSVAAPGEANV
jgi:hypothetical protein